MQRKNLSIILFSLTTIAAVTLWFVIDRAIFIPDVSTWLVPIVCFSVLFLLLGLSVVLIREILTVEILLLAVFLSSFIFVRDLWFLLFILLGLLVALDGTKRIRRDMELNVKVDLTKSLAMGRRFFIVAFVIVISGQYFFSIQKIDGEKRIPAFETGEITGRFTLKMMSLFNPTFKGVEKQDITVDEFILQAQKNQEIGIQEGDIDLQTEKMIQQKVGNDIPLEQKEELKKQAREKVVAMQKDLSQNSSELVLIEGRKQLSQMVGRQLSGTEKMSEIFSGFIDKKINDYFKPVVAGEEKSKVLPALFAIVLALTIWPMGSFLSYFLILLAALVFWLFVRFGVVRITKIPIEMEIIE